jgi:hypothetical protein
MSASAVSHFSQRLILRRYLLTLQISSVTTTLRDALSRLIPSSSGSLLPFVPKPRQCIPLSIYSLNLLTSPTIRTDNTVKAFLLLLIILNSPSFPFQWHLRVWIHALKAYYYVYRKGRTRYLDEWEANNVRQGQIKGVVSKMKRVAWVDDCDYNMHLSNSYVPSHVIDTPLGVIEGHAARGSES